MPVTKEKDSGRRGLTMIELAIALALVSVLAAVAVPVYASYRERIRVRDAISDIRVIETQIFAHRTEFGDYPASLTGVVAPAPRDPWGNPYAYLNLQSGNPSLNGLRRKDKNLVPINSDFDLYSKGPDGGSLPPLTAPVSRDDIVRANDGAYVGVAEDY